LLLPTAPTIYRISDILADPIRLNSGLGLYTNFVNLMDLSALAVPGGFRSDGLPFGITLIARAFDDGKLAVFGDRMHRAIANAQVGATVHPLADTPRLTTAVSDTNRVQVAVVGAHLSGQPLNWQLVERKARLVRTARTAPGYSFYALANTVPAKPGLVFDAKGPGGVEVEIWEMGDAAFGSFVGLIPPPLGIGTVTLDDGMKVKGFLCEAYAVEGAENITPFGGWRAWLSNK
jgi:allophanate hydrolase